LSLGYLGMGAKITSGAPAQSRQKGLLGLDQVECIEEGGSCGLSSTKFIEP